MNVSAILVVVQPSRVEATVEALGELDGVEVHHLDRPTGRIVVTQEAEVIRDEMDGLRRIKALPGVALAEMVSHYFEEDPTILDGLNATSEGVAVPPFLEDEPAKPGTAKANRKE